MTGRASLWLLLGSLVVLQFGYPVTEYGPWWMVAYLLFYSGIIVFGIREVALRPRQGWPIIPLTVFLIAAAIWLALNQSDQDATVVMLAAVGLFQFVLLLILVRRLMRPTSTSQTADLLLIAVSAYLLLGGVFGVLSSQIELANPGSYLDNTDGAGEITWQGLFYGSYVTLATLGYGDIVPVADWARSLSSLEAVVGTLFVAVVIARLVGLGGVRWALRDTHGTTAGGASEGSPADPEPAEAVPGGSGPAKPAPGGLRSGERGSDELGSGEGGGERRR